MFANEEWMTAERFTILFNAIIGLITAVTAGIAAYAARQAKVDTTKHLTKQDQKLEVIEKQTNGLVDRVATLAEQKGKAEGQAEVLKEMSAIKPPEPK